jgi:hypothetical protein
MNGDDKNLLNEVLAEATPTGFRDAMLNQTLRAVRRRRRWRQTRRATALLTVLLLCGVFVWRKNPPPKPVVSVPTTTARTAEKSYTLVETRPLPASHIVTTRPLAPGEFVGSTANVKIVETRSGNYRVINDDELLALVASHPAVLIRTGPHSEELVFADPKDQKGFPLN